MSDPPADADGRLAPARPFHERRATPSVPFRGPVGTAPAGFAEAMAH